METEKVICPKCGGSRVDLDERFWFSRTVFRARDGVVEVSLYGQMSDEPTADPAVLSCRTCGHTWEPPGGVEYVEE